MADRTTAGNRTSQRHQVGVIALNLQHASRSRSERQVDWLRRQDLGDVLVLSEVAGGDRCDDLVELLDSAGYAATQSDDAPNGYQVVVAFRRSTIDEPAIVLHCSARFVHVAATVRDAELEVVGLYVPSRGPARERNIAKRAFQGEVTAALPTIARQARRRGRGLIVAGDLNVVEPDHIPHHRVFGKWEYEFYESFSKLGRLSDAFHSPNGARLDHSWFGRQSGLGYRFDHMFTSAEVTVIECRYDQAPRHAGLSDHAAVKAHVQLDWPHRSRLGSAVRI